jgi:hypothetical protein
LRPSAGRVRLLVVSKAAKLPQANRTRDAITIVLFIDTSVFNLIDGGRVREVPGAS